MSTEGTTIEARGVTFTASKETGMTLVFSDHTRSESLVRFGRCRADPMRRDPYFHTSRRLVELFNTHGAVTFIESLRRTRGSVVQVQL